MNVVVFLIHKIGRPTMLVSCTQEWYVMYVCHGIAG